MKKIIVNYLWLNCWDSLFGFKTNRIPSRSFYNLQQNAQRYPNAEFRLWTASPNNHLNYAIPSNVDLYDLDKQTFFPACFDLKSKNPDHFWFRVDMTKLLIIKEVLSKNPDAIVIHSDFDIDDVVLASPMLHGRIDRFGVAFGASYLTYAENLARKLEERVIRDHYENGYIAFAKTGEELLDFIIAKAREISCKHRHSVYDVIEKSLDEWATIENLKEDNILCLAWRLWKFQIAGFPIQPATGWCAHTGPTAKEVCAQSLSRPKRKPKEPYKRNRNIGKNSLGPTG